MKSVADSLSRDLRLEVSKLTATERVALALSLGDEAVSTFASANGISRDRALRILRRNNQLGRRPSAAASHDVE